MPKRAVTILGIGADGCAGLSSRAFNVLTKSTILAGSEKQLAFFPDFPGRRIILGAHIRDSLRQIADLSLENQICVLATGDPLFFGIGALLVEAIGAEHVEIIPHTGSMQLAFARAGLKWDDAKIISLHGRPLKGLLSQIRRACKIGCFTDATNSPQKIAKYMIAYEEKNWCAWVVENLEGPGEKVRYFESFEKIAQKSDFSEPNIMILKRTDRDRPEVPTILNFPDEDFLSRKSRPGFITKKEVRLISVSELQIHSKSVIWDIGSGTGSIAIESACLALEGRVYAIESDAECLEIIKGNLIRFKADNVQPVAGLAPAILKDLETPDAVFIGGSKGNFASIFRESIKRLKPGGRIVANAVTMETISEAYNCFREHNILPDIIQLNVARGKIMENYTRYRALNPVHIFSASKPDKLFAEGQK